MKFIRACLVLMSFFSILHASEQPLITPEMMPKDQNVRLGLVHDADGAVDGDDYHGFTVSYASEIYPIDQMVATYTQLSPEGATARQAMLSLEEYYSLAPYIHAYGVAGAGFMWGGSDLSESVASDGWFGKLGVGVVFSTRTNFDVYLEYAVLASDKDLWQSGDVEAKSNNRHLTIGFRYRY